MACYGWTLDQALEVTLPQVNLLFRAMAKYPPAVAVLGSVFGSEKKEKDAAGALSKIGQLAGSSEAVRKVTASGSAFWKAIGLEGEPEAHG
jgi:hypothetical protein